MSPPCCGCDGSDLTSEAICEDCARAAGLPETPASTVRRVVLTPWANPLAEEEEEVPDTLPDFGEGGLLAMAEERRIEALIDDDTDFSGDDDPESDRYMSFEDLEDY